MSIFDIHTTSENYRELVTEYEQLREKHHRLREAIKSVVADLEDEFDVVDDSDGQPRPNRAMQIANDLDEALYGPGGF